MPAAADEPFAVLAADNERPLLQSRNDDDTVGVVEQILGNGPVGSRHDVLEDRHGLIQALQRFRFFFAGQRGRGEEQKKKNGLHALTP